MRVSDFHLVAAVLAPLLLLSNQGRAQEGPQAHWRLCGDVLDSSGNDRHAVNHGADLESLGPDGEPRGAATFDGKASWLEVPSSRFPDIGTRDFSILVWVHTDQEMDDVPGGHHQQV